jgi:hypothetical protein
MLGHSSFLSISPSIPTHRGNAEKIIGRKIVRIEKIIAIVKVFPKSQASRAGSWGWNRSIACPSGLSMLG